MRETLEKHSQPKFSYHLITMRSKLQLLTLLVSRSRIRGG